MQHERFNFFFFYYKHERILKRNTFTDIKKRGKINVSSITYSVEFYFMGGF